MAELPFLFLDFDGVICDSLDECIASSSYAYFQLYKKKEILSLPSLFKTRFANLRPYIRNGEDYLVIHEILDQNISIKNQAEFDEILLQYKDSLPHFKKLFYTARTTIADRDRDFWFSLNRIYPHVYAHLNTAGASPFFHILSTKRTDFIITILRNNRIEIAAEKILDSSGMKKLALISSILDIEKAACAIFIDDQIDHLKPNNDPRIVTYLASWGYVRKEWLEKGIDTGTTILDKDEMETLLKRY